MNEALLQDEELLDSQIADARSSLKGLERDLGRVETELEALAGQREQIALLEQVCGSLERLDELGGAGLFWGESAANETASRVRDVRGRMLAHQEQIGAIESRRDGLVARIGEGEEILRILEDDLLELKLAEEERQQEWVVEREIGELPARAAVMPWARGQTEDRRFHTFLLRAAAAALVLGAVIPWIELPFADLDLVPEVPERFARLIQQELPPPPPPAPVVEERAPEEVAPEPEPEPEPVLAEELPDEAPEVVEPPAPVVAEEPAPEVRVRSAGILAFRESFSDLADGGAASARLGSRARINSAGEAAVGRTERSMVTSQGPGSSGGINLASLSRDVGGGAGGDGLADVEAGRVSSSIGPGGASDRPLSGGALAGRTDEEIQIVFDRYKSALYRLYNRELRNDPTLQGQIVLQLTIEPDGSVSFCEVQSSDMNAAVLEQQVVDRVLTFDFGAKEGIAPVTILYPIDFLPAA